MNQPKYPMTPELKKYLDELEKRATRRLILDVIFGFLMGLAGLIILGQVSWKIALGVFFIVWCNNINQSIEQKRRRK